MSTAIIRPNALLAGYGGSWTGAVSTTTDNSDATFQQEGVANATIGWTFPTPTIPALAQIRSVTPRIRIAAGSGTATALLEVNFGSPASLPITTTITSFAGVSYSTNPATGVAWTAADLAAGSVNVVLFGAIPLNSKVYEVYLDIVYNEAPVATPTAPTGATGTALPTVTWTYTDPDADAQERAYVKIYESAVYLAGGFDVETNGGWAASTGTIQTLGNQRRFVPGGIFTTATSFADTNPLENGKTYRAYVKVADAGSSGRYGAWAHSEFTVTLDPPDLPTVTVSPSGADMAVVVSGHDNMLSLDSGDMEATIGDWTALANCAVAWSAAQAAQGTHSMAMTSSAAGDMTAICPTHTGSGGRDVFPGDTVTGMIDVRAAATARSVAAGVAWYDSGGVLLSTTFGTAVPGSTSAFVHAIVQATAPANAYRMRLVSKIVATAAAGEVNYVDKAKLAPGVTTLWTRGGLVLADTYPDGALLQLQRSDDGGTTWGYVRGMSPGLLYAAFPQYESSLFFRDREAPRGQVVQYRAQALFSIGGGIIASGWGPVTTATIPATGTYLKSVTDSSYNIALNLAMTELGDVTVEPQGIHDRILGRADPVIVSDTIRTPVLEDLVLWFKTDADFAAFDAIRSRQETLLLQTCYGNAGAEQMWIRLGDVKRSRITVDGMATAQPRQVTVAARVVAAVAVP